MLRAAILASLTLALAACRGGDLGAPCEDDGECRRELRCVDYGAYLGAAGGQCTLWCEADAECGDGNRCDAGACTKGCASDAECPDGTLCNDNGEAAECGRVCESEAECVEAGNWSCPVPGELCVP